MADSRCGTGNILDYPGIFWHTNHGSSQRCVKRTLIDTDQPKWGNLKFNKDKNINGLKSVKCVQYMSS